MIRKFLFVFLLLSCCLLMINCGGGDDDSGPTSTIIVPDDLFGIWQGTSQSQNMGHPMPDVQIELFLNQVLDSSTVVGEILISGYARGPLTLFIRESGRLEGFIFVASWNWPAIIDAEIYDSNTGPILGIIAGLIDTQIYDFRSTGGLTKI